MAAALCLSAMTGCLPRRVTIDLQPAAAELKETVVATDDGASPAAPKVALIDIRGLLAEGASVGVLGRGGNAVDDLVARLEKAADDRAVRAVVLRINSPGGTVAASDTMHREVRRFSERTGKPVVVSMGEVAASGGYYVALAADEIVAQPSTVTGSIGVIVQTVNLSAGMSRLGITARSVTSGPNKALASPFEPEQHAHYAILQRMVDDFYGQFLGLVEARRPGVPAADLPMYTDGRVVTGVEAARAGLVDGVGGVREAFASAKRRAGLAAARLVAYHNDGESPRSPYAVSAMGAAEVRGAGLAGAGAEAMRLNVVQVNLPGALGSSAWAGFYYLWTPPSP